MGELGAVTHHQPWARAEGRECCVSRGATCRLRQLRALWLGAMRSTLGRDGSETSRLSRTRVLAALRGISRRGHDHLQSKVVPSVPACQASRCTKTSEGSAPIYRLSRSLLLRAQPAASDRGARPIQQQCRSTGPCPSGEYSSVSGRRQVNRARLTPRASGLDNARSGSSNT